MQEVMNPLRLLPLVGGVAALSIGVYRWARSRRKTPEQRELERRSRIRETGRITDGTVLDAQEMVIGDRPVQLVIYQYDVAGVSYEASQDVTAMHPSVDLHTCRIGLPASVKYDPQNPGNSIVIAEGWSGLRL